MYHTPLMQALSNDVYDALLNDQFIKEHFSIINYVASSLEDEREELGYCPCCCSPE